jgi:hypothetical protein
LDLPLTNEGEGIYCHICIVSPLVKCISSSARMQ